MIRRSMLLAPLFGVLGLPAVVLAEPDTSCLENLKVVLEKAGRFYEDNMAYDSYVPYFNGVLASQPSVVDWVVIADQTGKKAGHIVDIAVKFSEGSEFVYIPLSFSADYWERGDRPAYLAERAAAYKQ